MYSRPESFRITASISERKLRQKFSLNLACFLTKAVTVGNVWPRCRYYMPGEGEITPCGFVGDSVLFSRCISKTPERSKSWDENLILAHGSKCSQSSVVGRHGPGCGSDLVARACGYTREQRTGPRTWGGGNH